MKPLSEQQWKDKLTEISMRIWNGDYELTFEETLKQVEDGLLDTILQDRKAYGEQLLTEAIQVVLKSNSIDVYDNMKKFRERQRNQGEKTDE